MANLLSYFACLVLLQFSFISDRFLITHHTVTLIQLVGSIEFVEKKKSVATFTYGYAYRMFALCKKSNFFSFYLYRALKLILWVLKCERWATFLFRFFFETIVGNEEKNSRNTLWFLIEFRGLLNSVAMQQWQST